MATNTLDDETKLKLFDRATRFELTNPADLGARIVVEIRSYREDSDVWAVTNGAEGCYNLKKQEWVYEPSPSNRTDEFIEQTRYPLDQAWEIAQQLFKNLGDN